MADNFSIQVSADTSKAESEIDKLTKQKRKIDIDAELNTSEIENQLKQLSNRKIQLDIEAGAKDQASKIAKDIERGLKNTKIDASSMAKSLADSFNISDKSVIKKMQSQINNMMSNLSSTWDGKKLDLTKASGFYDGIDELGKTVAQNAKIIESKLGIYDKFYDYAKNKKIYVSDDLKKSLGTDEYKELLKNNVGKITKDATKGLSIDSLWGELTSSFPEYFSDAISNQADQIRKYFDVLKSARADITKMISTSDMTPQQLIGISDDAFQHVVDLAGNIRDKLVQNLNDATEKSKTTFDLDVEVNSEKIVADIRNALSQIDSGEAIKINLDIDKSEIETQIRSAIQGISTTNTPLDIDINIDKQSIEADLKSALHDIDLPIQFQIDASDIESQIRAAVSAIDDIQIDVHVDVDNIREEIMQGLDNNPVQIPAQIDDNAFENINRTGREGVDIFTGLGESVRDAFSAYTLANFLERGLDKVVEAGREAIDTVKELDDASLQLQLATGKTREEAKSMISDYRELGNELGNLTQNVAESADEWLRQGKTVEETNTLIADSVRLATIGQISSSDATEYLTSAMNGYKVAVNDVYKISDKLSSIDMASATSAGGLAEAMSRTATSANIAGVSMDRLLAILATTGEVTQKSMSSIGESYKAIFARMRDIKAGNLSSVGEDGNIEDLSDVEIVLNSLGIKLRDTNQEFRNFQTVLDEVASGWNNYSSVQQAAIAKAFAGQRQQENFLVLMENYDRVLKYTDIAVNSEGATSEKFANYLDSLEAKTNKLKNSLEALATDTITDGLYEGFLETATAAADFARETDLVNTALIGLGTAGTTYVFRNLSTMIANTVTQVDALGGGLSGLWGVLAGHPIAMVTAGVVAAVGAWNLYQSTVKSANEKMAESFSSYEQAQSEVENVNNELLTTQSRIDELNAKQSLTFVEQSELDKLQEANEKLQLQLDLREKEEQKAARQAAQDTLSAYEKNYGKFDISESKTKEYIDNADSTGNNAILLSDENNISAMIAGIRQMQKLRQEAFNANDGYEVERYDEIINNATDSVWEQVTALEDYKSKLEAVKEAGGSLNTEEQNALSEIESTIEYVYKQLDPEKWNQMQFDNIFNQSRFSDAKESLKQIASESDNIGISAEEVKNKFPELVAEMKKAGFSAQDIANNINSQLGLLDFDEVKKQLKEAFTGDLGDNATYGDYKNYDARARQFNKFLKDKTDEEIEIFYRYVNDGDIDLSELTLEDIEELFIKVNADTTPAQKSLEELTQSANDVVSSISSINSVLSSQSTGQSISSDIFSDETLKDYSSALEYVNGCYQLNTEKVKELTKAKVDEQVATNNAKKAIEQQNYLENAKEIDSLRKKIEENNFVGDENAETIQSQIDSLLEQNSAIISNCNQLDVLNASLMESIGIYQQWKDAQNAGNSGDMFDDAGTAWSQIRDIADKESDMYGRVGTVQYQAAVDFLVPEEIDHSDQKAVQKYLDSIRKYMYFDDNGDVNGINMDNFFKSAVDKGLMVETEDSYEIAGQMTMQKFAEGMGMSLPLVQAIFGEIEEFMPEGDKWFDWSDEAVQSLGDLAIVASDAADALQSTEQFKNMDIQIDVSDLSTTEEQISALDATIAQMNQVKATPGVDTSQIEDANAIIQYCVQQKQALNEPAVMSVDTSLVEGQIGEAISLLQQFQQAQNELEMQKTLGLDTSEAESKVSNLTSEIQALNPKVTASLGIDPASTETIASTISALTPKMMVEAGVDDKAIIGYQADDKKAMVVYGVDHRKVDAYNPQNLERTVTYSVITQGTVPPGGTILNSGSSNKKKSSGKSGGSGANGTAHAYGTALANGAWGAKQGGMTLVGEMGQELLVHIRSGKYETIGDNGAEFIRIEPGDIIFNHLQTKELLKNGYTASRAQALVSGTAFASGNAMVTGSVPKNVTTVKNKNQTSTEKTSSKSKKSTSNNTKATDKNTTATNKNTEATENLQDWIEYSTNLQSKENDRLYSAIESFEMHANQNKAIDAYITDSQAYMNTLRNAQNAYMSKANALGLDANYIHKIWAGDDISFEDIQDEALRDKIEKYQNYYEKAKELGDQMTELNQKIRETKISKLDNIQDDYENLVSYAEGIINYNEAVNDLFESRNLVGNQDALMNNINQQMAIRQALVNEEKELTDQLNALVASGDIAEWTDTWLKWKNEINGVASAIVEADSALEELKKSIMEIRYKAFEDSLNNLDFNSDMFSSIRDLMSQEGIYDDNVKLTDSGKTQLALMEQELISAKQKVANYNTAIEALAKDLAYDHITQAQFNEKLQEYQKDQMSAIKATKDARDAILELVKDGITKESEAVQELIQKRKDDLSIQKEYYDFQKKMNDKSKEMNKIRAQIAAMEGDNSLETVAKRKKLMSQLQELEEEYNEELNDRKYDLVQDAYDKTNELTKENEEKALKELETNLNVQNEAIANALEVTKATYQTVYDQLNMLAQEYNFTLTDSLTSPWLNAQSAIDSYQQAIGKVQSNVSIDTSKIQGTTPSQNQTVPTKNEASTQNLDKSANGTWIKQGNQWWYQHADGSYTKNGWEQIDGKWYKFDQNGWMQSGWQPWGTDSTGQTAWYYMGDPNDGSMKTSTWVQGKDGKQYFVDHSGVMARNGYVKSVNSGMYYWVNGDGVWEPQWNTYNPNLNKYKLYYNSGKKRVPYNALAYIDDTPDHKLDLGSEAIITDKGALVQMDAGDTVFNKAQKEFLYEFSKGQISAGARSMLPSVNTNFASLQPRSAGNVINNIHYDTLMTVNGNVTNEQFMKNLCEKAFDYGNKKYRKYYDRLR